MGRKRSWPGAVALTANLLLAGWWANRAESAICASYPYDWCDNVGYGQITCSEGVCAGYACWATSLWDCPSGLYAYISGSCADWCVDYP